MKLNLDNTPWSVRLAQPHHMFGHAVHSADPSPAIVAESHQLDQVVLIAHAPTLYQLACELDCVNRKLSGEHLDACPVEISSLIGRFQTEIENIKLEIADPKRWLGGQG